MNDYYNLFKFSFIWNFHNKKCVVFILTSFGTLKYDCVIKAREMCSFLPLINNSGTTELSFSLLIISAIISSKTINILRFLFGLSSSIFLQIWFLLFDYSIKTLESLKCLKSVLSRLLIKNRYFVS